MAHDQLPFRHAGGAEDAIGAFIKTADGSSAAALSNLSGVLDEEPTVPDPSSPVQLKDSRGRLTLEHVRFSYRDVEVLHDLSIEIPAGQVVALVGRTGAGKTTRGRLVARFWDPTSGSVLLDGVDLREIWGSSNEIALMKELKP